MDINDLITAVAIALVWYGGYKFGQQVAIARMLKSIMQDPDTIQRAIEQWKASQKLPDTQGQFQVEQVGSAWYVYSQEGQFLAQAQTEAEAVELAKKRGAV